MKEFENVREALKRAIKADYMQTVSLLRLKTCRSLTQKLFIKSAIYQVVVTYIWIVINGGLEMQKEETYKINIDAKEAIKELKKLRKQLKKTKRFYEEVISLQKKLN